MESSRDSRFGRSDDRRVENSTSMSSARSLQVVRPAGVYRANSTEFPRRCDTSETVTSLVAGHSGPRYPCAQKAGSMLKQIQGVRAHKSQTEQSVYCHGGRIQKLQTSAKGLVNQLVAGALIAFITPPATLAGFWSGDDPTAETPAPCARAESAPRIGLRERLAAEFARAASQGEQRVASTTSPNPLAVPDQPSKVSKKKRGRLGWVALGAGLIAGGFAIGLSGKEKQPQTLQEALSPGIDRRVLAGSIMIVGGIIVITYALTPTR